MHLVDVLRRVRRSARQAVGKQDEEEGGRHVVDALHVPDSEIWGDMGRYGEIWGGVGRYREVWGDIGRYGEMWGGMGRYGEVWGDMGRYGEIWDPLAGWRSAQM